jgi:hypothetical protein
MRSIESDERVRQLATVLAALHYLSRGPSHDVLPEVAAIGSCDGEMVLHRRVRLRMYALVAGQVRV